MAKSKEEKVKRGTKGNTPAQEDHRLNGNGVGGKYIDYDANLPLPYLAE